MNQPPIHSRLVTVDCLRGAAALGVVLYHAISYGVAQPRVPWFRGIYAVINLGRLGVPLFFVLSGFCIHLHWAKQYAEKSRREVDFKSFWKRRFCRLYPPYFVSLCLCMTFVLVAYGMTMDVPLVSCYPEPRLKWIVADFLAHLGMLHGLHPILDRAGGNPPFWTLAREEYFYVMYFAVLAWRRALGLFVSLNLVVLLGLAFPVTMGFVLSTGSSWWSVVNSSAVVLWVQWCLGMVAVEAYYGIVRIPRCCSTFGFLPFWAGMAFTSEALVPALSPLTWGITFFTLVNACVARERTTRWPQGRVAGWLAGVGLYSYSLYLVHNPARYITKRLLGAYAETSDPGRYLLNAAIMALAGYVAGRLFFSLVERRFLPRNHGRVTSMVDDSDQGAVPVATKPAPTRAGLVRL